MIGDDTRAGLAVDTLMSHGAVNVSPCFHAEQGAFVALRDGRLGRSLWL